MLKTDRGNVSTIPASLGLQLGAQVASLRRPILRLARSQTSATDPGREVVSFAYLNTVAEIKFFPIVTSWRTGTATALWESMPTF